MQKLNVRLMAVAMILAVLSGIAAVAVPPAMATNVIQNPEFESSTAWVAHWASVMGTYAKVQDSAYKHTGSYSGLTQTTNIKQEIASATLYQSLSLPVSSADSLVYWIRKGSSAVNGYDIGKVCISISGGYTLSYYHGFDGSSPPPDSSAYKYINVGNTATNTWIQISRNLYNDLVTKFGSSIQTQTVAGIELVSKGHVDLDTLYKYGQRINWDDIALQQGVPPIVVSLTSSTLDGQTDVGTITFAGTSYALPNQVQKPAGSYSATANPPSGYSFDHWERIYGVTVSNSTSQTTTVTVSSTGTLKAVFKINIPVVDVNRYAIIVCGANVAIGYHDAAYVYHVLKEHYAFSDSNICYMSVNTTYPGVDMPATLSNFRWAVSSWLSARSTEHDTVFIYFVGHGKGFFYYQVWEDDPSDPYYLLMGGRPEMNGDEGNETTEGKIGIDVNNDGDLTDWVGVDECLVVQDQDYWDDDLKSDLVGVNYGSLIFATQSCFGGGFIDDLSANNRIILTATKETHPANSDVNNDGLSEWTKVFCDGLHGQKAYFSNNVLVHSGESVDADTSDNLRISMKEAFLYAYENDLATNATNLPPLSDPPMGFPPGAPPPTDEPWLDDNGDRLANSNDGTRAACTYLAGLAGDVNRDGIVNNLDVNIVNNALGSIPGDANWNPIADINEDRIINSNDDSLVDQDFNKRLAS